MTCGLRIGSMNAMQGLRAIAQAINGLLIHAPMCHPFIPGRSRGMERWSMEGCCYDSATSTIGLTHAPRCGRSKSECEHCTEWLPPQLCAEEEAQKNYG